MAAQREVRLDPLLEGRKPDLVEPLDRALRERLVREVGERWAAPERQCLAEELGGTLRFPSASS